VQAAVASQAVAGATQPVEPAAFPPDAIRETCEKLVARYPTKMAALLPVLHVAQRHYGGWVSPEVEAGVAAYLDVSPAHVRGVLTFYAMYHTEKRGRHEVWVCRTLTCWLRGAQKLSEVAHEKAGLERKGNNHPQTSEDGKFTVMEMECLGLCEVAPAVFVDGEPHVDVTPESFASLLDGLD
jgi:NADH-quinone oxidoreductase subunit E